MRFISGLILGFIVALGGAYIHDSSVASSMSGPDVTGARLVNWDAVSHSFNRVAQGARQDFDRLLGRHQDDRTSGA